MLKWVQKGVKRIFKKDKKNRNGNIYMGIAFVAKISIKFLISILI